MEEDRNSTEFCPGCGRHCALTDPHCERGEAFARTGALPQGGDKEHRRKHCGCHGHGHGHHDREHRDRRD